jgi:diguanylate cyclase (GGDEF)-like protein
VGRGRSKAEERRRFERFPIRLDAQLKLGGPRSRECTVVDYCSGGMLARLDGGSAPTDELVIGSAVRLRTNLATPEGSQGIAIPSHIAWCQGDLVGIAFDRPSRTIVSRLQAHERISTPNRPTVVTRAFPEGDRILRHLRHLALELLPPVLRELLVQTGQRLLDAADQAISDNERHQVYVDLAALERVRNEDPLTPAVLALSFDRTSGTAEGPEYRDSELSLIENEEFEHWLEASKLATRLERQFDAELTDLGSRFAALREDTSYISLAVPLEPQHFTGAIRSIAQKLELGATTRRVMYETAQETLTAHLPEIYRALQSRLDELGAPARRNVAPARARSGEPGPLPQPDPHGGELQPTTRPVAEHTPIPLVGDKVPLDIDSALVREVLANEQALRATQAEELVQVLADQGRSRGDLSDWLERLSGSLLQEATHSDSFFHDLDHPLRSIIDDLAHLQLFIPNSAEDDRAVALQQVVAQLIEPITSGDADADAVQAIAREIEDLTGQHSHRYRANVARVVEAAEGRERVRIARVAVAEELNLRYAGRKVPAILAELLDVGWLATLELACLNRGAADETYLDSLALLDRVVAQLGGEAIEQPAEDLQPWRLAEMVHRELDTVAFDPYRRNSAETALRQALVDPTSDGAALVTMTALHTDQPPPAEDAKPTDISRAGWRFALEQCASIRIGDHLAFIVDGRVDADTRVAWIRGDREMLTLVDHQGLKARDISLVDLAAGLHCQSIRLDVVDGRPLSETAVETMLGRMQQQLAFQSAHDTLTGLPNRRQFQSSLQQLLSRGEGTSRNGSLMWVDIDRFRLINDMHGYEAADRLLVAVARQLEQTPGAELVGHIGGDRFALALPGVAPRQAMTWAETICAALRMLTLEDREQRINATASVGVAALDQGGVEELMVAAEHAVTAAKAAGGDRPYRYTPDDPDIQRNRDSAQWLIQVDESLERGQMHLRCQPIVPLRPDSGAQFHYEVLLGVSNTASEALELLPFIEAAERYQRMRNVDRWVLKAITTWIDEHRSQMDRFHGFAVNLSGQTASDPSFVEFARQQFERRRIAPGWISFEITETSAMTDIAASVGIVHDLKSLGCKVALDDFGSGLASYAYLKELPVDWLKIDGAFVRRVAATREDFAVVKSINDIGHFLGKKTIAEFVADQSTLDHVRALGVDFAQGHLISPPRRIEALLEDWTPPSVDQAPPVPDTDG